MGKKVKWILIILACIISISIVVLGIMWRNYKKQYSMKPAIGFEINSPDLDKKILISTQGSEFKDALVKKLTNELKSRDVYIRVVDDQSLKEISPLEWNIVILIHTTEMCKISEGARDFLKRTKDLNKVLLITTSGNGEWKQKEYEVDSISSASEISEIDSIVEKTIIKIDETLNK